VIGQKLNSKPIDTQVTSGRTIKSMEKVVVFVDVQNIYYTTKEFHNCHFDYNAFWAKATSNREVVKAIAYAIYRSDESKNNFKTYLGELDLK